MECVKDETKEIPNFCTTCMVRKPLRSKHCKTCHRCVARFDHHCGWLNNCVGTNNIGLFLVCLTMVILNHAMFSRFCLISLSLIPNAPLSWVPLNVSIPFYYKESPLIFVLFFFHFLNLIWQFWLVYGLYTSIRNDITTNEYINKARYSYLKHPTTGNLYSPWSRGSLFGNIKDLLYPTENWYTMFSFQHFQK